MSSHTLANGVWKLGQRGGGTSLALTGKPWGGVGSPGPLAQGPPFKVGCRGSGQATSLRAWPRLRSVWMPAAPQPQIQFMPPCGACGLGSLCSFSLYVSEPACISPAPDRCVCLRRGQAWHMAFIFFFPSKQQNVLPRMGHQAVAWAKASF